MPTENRSSNTETVGVPRELLERLDLGKNTATALAALPALRALLAQSAQHQGEPVAVLYANGAVLTKADCGDVFDICCKIETPLYTHADPGEVERLREALAAQQRIHQRYSDAMCEMGELLGIPEDDQCTPAVIDAVRSMHAKLGEVEQLRADLARMRANYADALEASRGFWQDRDRMDKQAAERDALLREAAYHATRMEPMSASCLNRIDAVLDAGAGLSAPKCKACADTGVIDEKEKDELSSGHYAERGLVACKQCEEPTALSKCALCDQLQADLTARDELIDQLRSGYVFEAGPYEVELSDAQWSAALGVFENYNMGDDKHFVFLEEQGRGVISEILIEIGVARAPDADELAE